jgi:hypothetical protein
MRAAYHNVYDKDDIDFYEPYKSPSGKRADPNQYHLDLSLSSQKGTMSLGSGMYHGHALLRLI